METGECIKTINEHTNVVVSIMMVSDNKFVTGSFDKTMKLFDMDNFNCIRTFIGHEDKIYDINKLSIDKIVSLSDDKTIRIWNLTNGECLKEIKCNDVNL